MVRKYLFFQNCVCSPFYLRKCDFKPLEWAIGDVISARLSAKESSDARHLHLEFGNSLKLWRRERRYHPTMSLVFYALDL